MDETFTDTAAWIALINRQDSLHQRAWTVFGELEQQRVRLITTEFVLIEVADGLSAPAIRQNTIRFIEELANQRSVEIVPVSHDLFAQGWKLYRQRSDKGWSLTDCISFSVMTERQISLAFTSDHHFTQAGFQTLL